MLKGATFLIVFAATSVLTAGEADATTYRSVSAFECEVFGHTSGDNAANGSVIHANGGQLINEDTSFGYYLTCPFPNDSTVQVNAFGGVALTVYGFANTGTSATKGSSANS